MFRPHTSHNLPELVRVQRYKPLNYMHQCDVNKSACLLMNPNTPKMPQLLGGQHTKGSMCLWNPPQIFNTPRGKGHADETVSRISLYKHATRWEMLLRALCDSNLSLFLVAFIFNLR
jgi:hypothetical protein